MTSHALKMFFDGGCRPNPGKIETAVVTRGVVYLRTECPAGTNSDAEWLAAIHALEVAIQLGARHVDLRGDSMMVIGQGNGTAKCRTPQLQRHKATFDILAERLDTLRLRHVGRSRNLAGIALAQRHPR